MSRPDIHLNQVCCLTGTSNSSKAAVLNNQDLEENLI